MNPWTISISVKIAEAPKLKGCLFGSCPSLMLR
jgi:hypothetical protein